MKMNEIVISIAALFVLAITGCGQRQSKASEQTQAAESPRGRSETKNLQAAGLVGYDGKQLRKSVDKVLDANDQRNKKLEDDIHKSDDQ